LLARSYGRRKQGLNQGETLKMTQEELAELKRTNDLKEQEIALKKREISALNAIADRPVPYSTLERLDRWWNGPRHRDYRSDQPRRI
jgi:hypothetical protein